MPKRGICEYYNKSCGRKNTVETYEEPPLQSAPRQESAPQKDPNVIVAEKFNQTCKLYVVLSKSCPHCQNFMKHAEQYNLTYITVEQTDQALYTEILQAVKGAVPAFKVVSDQFGSVKFAGYGGSLVWLHEEVNKRIQVRSPQPTGGGGGHPINQKHGELEVWLSDSCPWCQKCKTLLDENSVQYKVIEDRPPPKGMGVPQIRSTVTDKVCVGYRDLDGIMNELN